MYTHEDALPMAASGHVERKIAQHASKPMPKSTMIDGKCSPYLWLYLFNFCIPYFPSAPPLETGRLSKLPMS